jgi:predicted AAA+ superfamily ATPase
MKVSSICQAIDEQAAERKRRLGMPRDVLPQLPSVRNFATVVTGVRRSGKSTLLDQWTSENGGNVVSVHFDDLRLASFSSNDFLLLYEIAKERKVDTLVLDEVQDIVGWEKFVVGCLDRKLRVMVTGSNAKLLSREFGTKLTGRHLNIELFPFSYPEFLRFTKKRASKSSIDEYLSIGGFPAYVESRQRMVLSELFNDILYRDIVVRYSLKDAAPIKGLATFLLAHVGCRISPSRIKDSVHVASASTILEYFNYLEETYLVQRIPRFAASQKASMSAPKKVYACDTGLVSAIESIDEANLGHKLENLVYLKLRNPDDSMFYFVNDADGTECDFVIERRDGTFGAVQVCWELSRDNEEREINGALRAMERFGLKEAVLVTRDQSDLISEGGRIIRVVPAWKWLCGNSGEIAGPGPKKCVKKSSLFGRSSRLSSKW